MHYVPITPVHLAVRVCHDIKEMVYSASLFKSPCDEEELEVHDELVLLI